MSYHRLSVKPLNTTLNTLIKRAAHVGLGVGAFTPILALANPTGGQVVAGQATIAAQNANNKLVISQASNSAIINWQQFSIDKGQYVQFLQPSSSSVVLNRVVGGNASSILGSLSANGQVFLVNPNGIFFGKSASLDVQGIVASTLDIADTDFMNRNYVFNKGTGSDASVINQGNIHAGQGGYIVLAGDYSENDGIIQAKSGHIILASGTRTTLTLSGNNLVSFAVNEATLAQLAGAKNTGSLVADGGTIIMTADVANALKATVVNNTGLIEAHAIGKNGGAIYLTAEGGNLNNAGTLDADATASGRAGGDIVLKADGLTNLTNTSKISATGLNAEGGNLEVSGHTINVRGAATLGHGGNMLLDPASISIDATNPASQNTLGAGTVNNTGLGHVSVGFIDGKLNNGTNVAISAHNLIEHSVGVTLIKATTPGVSGPGNLSFKVGSTGDVELKGMDITIAGNLTASFGYGSFGFIQAKSVTLHGNSNSSITLHNAVTSAHGAVTKNSIKATGGNVIITGGHLGHTSTATALAIQAVGGSINLAAKVGNTSNSTTGNLILLGKSVTDSKLIRTTGDVNITASAGAIGLSGSEFIAHNITMTATGGAMETGNLTAGGALAATATGGNMILGNVAAYGGNLTLTDTAGNMSVGIVSAGANATLNDTGHILNLHPNGGSPEVRATGNMAITATTIEEGEGSELFLQAGGNLNLKGQLTFLGASNLQSLRLEAGEAGTITLNKSVATNNGAVTIQAGKLAFTGGKSFSISAHDGDLSMDAAIGSSHAFANYNVNLKDQGYGIFIKKSIFTGATAGGLGANITATQNGLAGSSNALHGVLVGNSSGAAVTLLAGGSVTLKGENVGLAHARHNSSSASSYGAVKVFAGKAVLFSASGSGTHNGNVGIVAGNAETTNAKRDTSILVKAGTTLTLTGRHVNIQAGIASADIFDGQTVASDNANVTLIAGGSMDITGGGSGLGKVAIAAGSAFAIGQESFKKTNSAVANANVSISAGKNITIAATAIQLSAGYGVANASANEQAAVTTETATADLSLKAGRNISITGESGGSGFVSIKSGHDTGLDGDARALASHARATASAHADVSLTAGGAITLDAHRALVTASYGAGFQSSGITFHKVAWANGIAAAAAYTATNNLTFTAGVGGISIDGFGVASSSAVVKAGHGIFNKASASGDGIGAKATATASGRVSFTTTGTINVLSNHNVVIGAGNLAAAMAKAEGLEAGTALMSGDGGLAFTAANINLGSVEGGNGHLAVNAGSGAARSDTVHADFHEVAAITGSARLDLTATGNITMNGGHTVRFEAGKEAASHGIINASSGGHATLSGNGGISMTAGGAITLTAGVTGSGSRFVDINGGNSAASGVHVTALSGGVASVSGLGSAVITAGHAFTVKGANVDIQAGSGAARGGNLTAGSSHGGGKATLTGNGALNITAGSVLIQGGSGVNLSAGSEAGSLTKVIANHGGSAAVTGIGDLNVVATGAIKITTSAAGSGVGLLGGSSIGSRASAATHSHARAALTASGKLNVQGKSVTISASQADVNIVAGDAVGQKIQAHADGGGQVAANVAGGVSIKATGGVLNVTAKKHLTVRGGRHAAEGSAQSGTNSSFLGTSVGGSKTSSVTRFQVVNLAAATAKGAGAKATVSANAGVSLSATGTVTLHQTSAATGSMNISGGYGAAAMAYASADNGATATLSAAANVAITGGALSFKGRVVGIHGGNSAAAATISGSHHFIQHTPVSGPSFITSVTNNFFVQPDVADGKASKVALSGNAAVTLTGGTVGISASNGSVSIAAGNNAGRLLQAEASGGGQAAANGAGGVSIKATSGDLDVTSKTALSVRGGEGAAAGTRFSSSHGRSFGTSIGGSTSRSVNRSAIVTAAAASAKGAGANAAVSGTAGVSLSATGTVNLHQTSAANGSLNISAGYGAASIAHASANGGGVATLSGAANIVIAGGALSLKGRQVSVRARGGAAAGTAASSEHFVVHTSTSGSTHVTSSTSHFERLSDAAKGVGSKVAVSGNGSVTMTGGAVGISAAVGQLQISNGGADGKFTQVEAHNGGSATLLANDLVSIKAAGVLTLAAAAGNVSIGRGCCNEEHGLETEAVAGGPGAKAAVTVNDSLLLQGAKAVSMTAGNNLTITTASGGSDAGASASFKGVATFTQTETLNIVTGGAFTAKAGHSLGLFTGLGGGGEFARAHLTGAQATFSQDDRLNVSANTVALSAGHSMQAAAGELNGWRGFASASGPATATLSANNGLNITAVNAISMMLTGSPAIGGGLLLNGGGSAGLGAEAQAVNGGKATLSELSDLNLKVTGATGTITLSAGKHTGASLAIHSGRPGQFLSSSSLSAGFGAVAANGGVAAATATGNVTLSAAGALALNAGIGGNLALKGGGNIASSAFVLASGSKAKATATASAVTSLSGGTVTLTAGGNISLAAAHDLAGFAGVHGVNGGAAALTAQSGLKIATPGAFTATAGSNLKITGNGSNGTHASYGSVGHRADVTASFAAAQATLTATDTIQIAAAAVTLKASNGSLSIDAGGFTAASAHVDAAAHGDKATLSADDSVTITATHNVIATGANISVAGGAGDFSKSMNVFAGSGATAKLAANSGVNIRAGGGLALTATGTGNLNVHGGNGLLASVEALGGGLGSAVINAGVALKAGTTATLTAGGSLNLLAGGQVGIAADLFHSAGGSTVLPPGTVKGTLNTSVSLTAGGSAALLAGGNLAVAAGAGETLTVGTRRLASSSGGSTHDGHVWGGGSANLSANLSATVVAGKNLTVSAGTGGTGSLQVLALRKNPLEGSGFKNIVSVAGGSNHAVAKLTLNGNATLTAGGNITVNAAGNASIAGGEIDDVRADHTVGNVSLTGSADAGLHAGVNVVLNDIQGSLTLAGANVGPSAGQMLVDAHGDVGTAVAIGHVDAFISAGNDIVTVTAMTGGLNLLGGQLVAAVALGSAANQHATATANASLKAGRNVTITGGGDLNVLGGSFDEASVSAASVGTGDRTAALQAHAAITAGNVAKLTLSGNGFIAGGDSVQAIVQYSGAGLDVGIATVDAGASIKGAGVALTVSGDLLARGGSGAKATAITVGQAVSALASNNVGVNIAATRGNLAITVNGAQASFLGGSGVTGKAENLFSNNVATATANANLHLSATGSMTLTIAGDLLVAGGPDAQQFGTVIGGAPAGRLSSAAISADNSKTTVTATGAVQFTAGGAIAVKQTGGNLTILGGSDAASFNSANAVGSHAVTKLTVDSNVLIKAGGALTFTGANNVLLSAGKLVTSGSNAPSSNFRQSGSTAKLTVLIDSSVKLTGTAVSIAHAGSINTHSSHTVSSGGLTQIGTVTTHAAAPVHAAGMTVHTLSVRMPASRSEVLHLAPLGTQTSFGGVQGLSGMPVTDVQGGAAQPVSVQATPAAVNVQATATAPLSTLQDAGLVVSLVGLVGPQTDGSAAKSTLVDAATLFTPTATGGGGYSSSFSGDCVALVVQDSRSRCASGGK